MMTKERDEMMVVYKGENDRQTRVGRRATGSKWRLVGRCIIRPIANGLRPNSSASKAVPLFIHKQKEKERGTGFIHIFTEIFGK